MSSCRAINAAIAVACLSLAMPASADETAQAPFGAAECDGHYPKHLQGICTDQHQHIYWSFTVALVKTDREGKALKQVEADDHHGDLCYHDGRLYVAVNLGKFNLPAGQADSWVYVYDADSLEQLARHETPQVVHGAGGIGYHNGRFIVVGGLPGGVQENYLYEYDESFAFQRRHELPSGPTLMGIQTAAYAQGAWWFGCYGSPRVLLKTDDDFQLVGKYRFDASLGIEGIAGDRFLVGAGSRDGKLGSRGVVKIAVADDENGLRLLETDTE